MKLCESCQSRFLRHMSELCYDCRRLVREHINEGKASRKFAKTYYLKDDASPEPEWPRFKVRHSR